jgi:hypothetical protein
MSRKRYAVDESEEVARILFSPSMVVEDRISRNAFFLERLKSGAWEDYLSVWRTLYKMPSKNNVAIPPRTEGDSVYGFASLTVATIHAQDCLNCSARVYRMSKEERHFHVGVFYELLGNPIVGKCDAPAFMALTMALANEAKLNKF